jgi:hypothetical protein
VTNLESTAPTTRAIAVMSAASVEKNNDNKKLTFLSAYPLHETKMQTSARDCY